jgi:hypothetical protein
MPHAFDENFIDAVEAKLVTQDPELDACLDKVNLQYFDGKKKLPIGWCSLPDSVWAHYATSNRSIRINSRVKNRETWPVKPPASFLDYLIFHEILHDIYPTVSKNGRQYDHPPEFRRHERKFPDYDEIREWEILETQTRTSPKYAKFGTEEYRKIFEQITKSPTNALMAYFHVYQGNPKDKWAVLGIDPARRKYCLQAINLLDSGILWFHPFQCVWR